ncbi:hypothetical protein [Amycolatopsis sp. NPDC102389]|uniref:hypothetical protein n=1 Tax=Amycolatopsis sp. NPDC102389 TaxID=3363941 RepID=UPI0037FA7615
MEPVSGLAVKSAPSRLSSYAAIYLTSVLLPGAVLVTELVVLCVHLVRRGRSDIAFTLDTLADVKGAGTFVLVLATVAASFVVGYLSREVGFKLTALLERFTRRNAAPTLEASWTRVRGSFGDDFAERLAELHPILRHLDPDESRRDGTPDRDLPVGGGHRSGDSLNLFAYSKLWLRGRAPTLSVDIIETEINILVSTLLPVLVLALDATVLSGTPVVLKILALPCAVLICVAILISVLRLRKIEQNEALRNLAFDFAMREAEARYPVSDRRPEEDVS